MSIKNHIVLLLGILVALVFNSTVLASSCRTTTGTTCTVNCPAGNTVSLTCGNNQCTGTCKNISTYRIISGLVTDIYRNNKGKIAVSEIIEFLKKSNGVFSETDRIRYGDIMFPDLIKEVSDISGDDWKVIEKSFSGLTKEQIMNRKQYEDEDLQKNNKPTIPHIKDIKNEDLH